jgi:TRAP-type C4-dicarboxylate transport system substrate-binding protein
VTIRARGVTVLLACLGALAACAGSSGDAGDTVGSAPPGAPDSAGTAKLAPRLGGLAPAGTAADAYWQAFAANARARSQGRIDPVMLTRGEVGSDEQILHALRRNRLQIAINGAHAISGALPEFAILGLPYQFDSDAEAEYVASRFLEPRLDPLLRQHGLRLLRLLPMGFHNLYARQRIRVPAELRGLRVRQPTDPASAAYAHALGLDLAPLPASEIVTALQTGLIQAGTTVTLNYLWSGMTRDAPHLTLTQHAYLFNAVLANDSWWQSLSPADRSLIETAFGSAAEYAGSMRVAEERGVAAAVARGEVEVIELTPQQRAQWRAPAADIGPRLVLELGGQSQAVYDAIDAGRTAWAQQRPLVQPLELVKQ